ncbi:hypothetical protein BDW22DRAFT_1431252 [Trametopsis cervina]|nr:hypothetical protein BDW22DRAFT_1431252 [Trametopsis cervina]
MPTGPFTLLDTPALFWKQGNGWDSGLYVSPNVSYMATDVATSVGDFLDVWTTMRPRWVDISDYWTACVPRDMIWEGFLEPLARLDIVEEVINGSTTYKLGNAAQWFGVESTLMYTYKAMCKLGLLTSLDFKPAPWPHVFGYHTRRFATRKEAKRAFSRARAGFLAQYRHGRACRRAGMIIRMNQQVSEDWRLEVTAIMTQFGAPVYLFYGQQPVNQHSLALDYLPTDQRVLACRSQAPHEGVSTLTVEVPLQSGLSTLIPPSQYQDDQRTPTSLLAPQTNKLRPDPITRQLPGQTWQEFMEAEAAYCKTRMEKETESERAKRLQREDVFKDKRPPSRRIKAFIWEQNEEGLYIRRIMTRTDIESDWEFIPDEQKRFNSVRGEYDICVEFAPNAATPEVYWYAHADQDGEPPELSIDQIIRPYWRLEGVAISPLSHQRIRPLCLMGLALDLVLRLVDLPFHLILRLVDLVLDRVLHLVDFALVLGLHSIDLVLDRVLHLVGIALVLVLHSIDLDPLLVVYMIGLALHLVL